MAVWLLIVVWAAMLATGAHAEPIGSCAWSRISPATKITIFSAYRAGMDKVAAALREMSGTLSPYFVGCSSSNLATSDMASMITTQAIEYAATTDLSQFEIGQADLDRAWLHADQASRNCAIAASATEFGMEPPACSGPQASFSFMQQLNVPPTASQFLIHDVLAYMAAKGQEYWEDRRASRASTLANGESVDQSPHHPAGS